MRIQHPNLHFDIISVISKNQTDISFFLVAAQNVIYELDILHQDRVVVF